MNSKEGIELIKNVKLNSQHPQVWADLGCGSGFFSQVLASLLPEQSRIYCCDREQHVEPRIFNKVQLEFIQLDFDKERLEVPVLDGILMANSLHYVKRQEDTLLKWKKLLNPGGIFIVIEYETESSNPWVPFPVNFAKLKKMFTNIHVNSVTRLGERHSMYGDKLMYACEAIV